MTSLSLFESIDDRDDTGRKKEKMASSSSARSSHHQQHQAFSRQATILRKNLNEWDRMLRTPRGEDWPTMLGRLNAALVSKQTRSNVRCNNRPLKLTLNP
jgi:hypothetical protein